MKPKPKTTKVYKLCSQWPGGRFWSLYSPHPVEYRVGDVTTPEIRGTRLFAFLKLGDARDYGPFSHIFEAEATGVQNSKSWISNAMPREALKQFKSLLEKSDYPSAVTCTSIKLIKKI
jgi:hypothetical protein